MVVFSPQIIENFRRKSAEGLSIQFIVIWLLGDVFNILGAVLQGVLPTMIILAFYYTIADIVLLVQCFYYRGFTLSDYVPTQPSPPPSPPQKLRQRNGQHLSPPPTEHTGLLSRMPSHERLPYHSVEEHERRDSWTHLSPAVPFVPTEEPLPVPPPAPPTFWQSIAFNSLAILMVCAAGVAGWWLSRNYEDRVVGGSPPNGDNPVGNDPVDMDPLGQTFGWLCAVLYLGSRLPQLLLNWRRKSTEGISVLFFLFACLGNLTYVLSILAFEPRCVADESCQPGEVARLYWQNILVNSSWLAGSAGTLLLDMAIFVQFFLYNKPEEEYESSSSDNGSSDEESLEGESWDQRPLLERESTEV